MNVIETENALGITFCERLPLVVERGEGSWVWDNQGARYLDFTSGWGVTCLGHCHPVITDAIVGQAGRILQNPNSGFTYSPSRARALQTLRRALPGGLSQVFFANSGAEANDAALKLARKVTGRTKVVATRGAFHGRTFNTLSVSGGRYNTQRFLPVLADTHFVPYGSLSAMAEIIDRDTAAVILEPVQGEGGVRIPPPDYLPGVARLCAQAGALLIVDEVQTGCARTGRFLALEHTSTPVVPDVLTLGKGLAGGFPLAAFAVTPSVASALEKGDHGGTYCGNPLACAVAHAVVDYLLEHDVAARAARQGQTLLTALQQLRSCYDRVVLDVRGVGLLCALDLGSDEAAWRVTRDCLRAGLVVTPTRNGIVRLLPQLLVSQAEIDTVMGILEAVIARQPAAVAAAS